MNVESCRLPLHLGNLSGNASPSLKVVWLLKMIHESSTVACRQVREQNRTSTSRQSRFPAPACKPARKRTAMQAEASSHGSLTMTTGFCAYTDCRCHIVRNDMQHLSEHAPAATAQASVTHLLRHNV